MHPIVGADVVGGRNDNSLGHCWQEIRRVKVGNAKFASAVPGSRIAVHPLSERDQSKLLVFKEGLIQDQLFTDLPAQLPPQSQLIFNNTRVVRARLHFVKTEGAKPIEIFCLGPHAQ
ncbi:MAG: S-adenosylmethionine:tRNA ribosyltransferase-isomerase, partial [Schleiferiaceae bacterium]